MLRGASTHRQSRCVLQQKPTRAEQGDCHAYVDSSVWMGRSIRPQCNVFRHRCPGRTRLECMVWPQNAVGTRRPASTCGRRFEAFGATSQCSCRRGKIYRPAGLAHVSRRRDDRELLKAEPRAWRQGMGSRHRLSGGESDDRVVGSAVEGCWAEGPSDPAVRGGRRRADVVGEDLGSAAAERRRVRRGNEGTSSSNRRCRRAAR